jgi:hypothetical protein
MARRRRGAYNLGLGAALNGAKTLDRRIFFSGLGVAALAALPGAALAAAKDPVKLAKAYPYLDAFLKLPAAQRSRFHPAYYLMVAGKPPVGLHFYIIDGGQRSPLVIEPDGRLAHTPTLAQLQGSAQFWADVPAETKIGLRLEIQANLPPAVQLDCHELSLAITQAGDAVKSIAGPMAFAAPKITVAAFPGAVGGAALLPDNRRYPLAVGKFGPFYDPSKAPGATKVSLTHAPSRILLESPG